MTALFLDFLQGPARNAEALFILGDLFEYWAGDDDPDPFNGEICAALHALSASGTPIHFMSGNRDLLIERGFAASSGAMLIDEPQVLPIAGAPTLLLHGDVLCTDDADYQRYRAMVRDPLFRRSFLAKPLAERKAFIGELRQRSENEKQTKSAQIMDANAEAVVEAFRRHDLSRMIHGHTHRQARHIHEVDGRTCERWVLGDWNSHAGNFLECSSAGWKFNPWPRHA